MSDTERHWVMEDHICRVCNCRILRCVKNNGMTPGGNAIKICSGCGEVTTDMTTKKLCWCGFKLKAGQKYPYRCVRVEEAKTNPKIDDGLRSVGINPEKTTQIVGMMPRTYDE